MVWEFKFGKFVHVKVIFGVNIFFEPLEVEGPKNESAFWSYLQAEKGSKTYVAQTSYP